MLHASLPPGVLHILQLIWCNPSCCLQAPAAAPSKGKGKAGKKGKKGSGGANKDGGGSGGASTISSGIKLENITITFKNQQVLRGVTWDVKKGERVGLVGAWCRYCCYMCHPDAGLVIALDQCRN